MVYDTVANHFWLLDTSECHDPVGRLRVTIVEQGGASIKTHFNRRETLKLLAAGAAGMMVPSMPVFGAKR